MFSCLHAADLLFFSPAINSLPRHIQIKFSPIRLLKQVGVSLWLHFNASRIIAEHHLDRLNIHAGPGGVLCIRRLPVPVIVTCHHTYRQQIGHIRSQFWKAIFLPFERATYRRAAQIIAVSEATKNALITQYGVPEQKITVIHNVVDTDRFYPLKTEKTPHSLLYIGRIDKRKGIDFLIRSMVLVREQLPDVQLLVGGKGPYLDKMRSLVNRLGLERTVVYLGFVPDDQLNGLYNRAQCVVVPSIFEGFGITVIEALAAGTRVVGTDSDGIREILMSGPYGTLVPYGDCRAMADAIVAELKGRRPVEKLHPVYHVDQFKKYYEKTLGINP